MSDEKQVYRMTFVWRTPVDGDRFFYDLMNWGTASYMVDEKGFLVYVETKLPERMTLCPEKK